MMTVGKMAKKFGLSRTALLYYDSIGLLSPSGRGENGYRLYSEADIERMGQIMSLRNAGIQLNEIAKYLDAQESDISSILLKRLNEMNHEIEGIRNQQEIIVRLLGNSDLQAKRVSDVRGWVKILHDAGVQGDTALQWHRYFEMQSPEQHHSLLKALGFSEAEIEAYKAALENGTAEDDLKEEEAELKSLEE